MIARQLLIAGAMLGLAAVLLTKALREPTKDRRLAPVVEKFSLLCGDPVSATQLRFRRGGKEVALRRAERWRFLDGTPAERVVVQTVLNLLRQNKAMEIDADPEALGVGADADSIMVRLGAHECGLRIGAAHPTKPLRAVRLAGPAGVRIGWTTASLIEKTSPSVEALTAVTVIDIVSGTIDKLQVQPQIGAAYELQRQRGGFKVHTAAADFVADPLRSEELLAALTGLKGTYLVQPPELSDPDLRFSIDDRGIEVAIFSLDDRLLARQGGDVFQLSAQVPSALSRGAGDLRSLQVIDYDRAAIAELRISDGSGRVFTYRREAKKRGVDRWFSEGNLIESAHRLAALQWDLHTLRGALIVDQHPGIGAAPPSRLIKVVDGAGKLSVDLKLVPKDGAWLVQNGAGPVFRIGAATVRPWPFEQLR